MMSFDPAILALLPMFGAIAAGVAAPVTIAARALDRWRGRRRNAGSRCARCRNEWSDSAELFVVDGLYVCEECAEKLRRFLGLALPALGVGVLGIAALSAIGLLFGSPIIWNFNGLNVPNWVIGVAPALIIGGGVVGRIALGKHANRHQLRAGDAPELLETGQGFSKPERVM